MVNHPNRKKSRAVVITTQHRGVFFGYTSASDQELARADAIKLTAARNCLYWSRSVKGFMGLAATGPDKDCRIGPAVEIVVRNVTSTMLCTPEATKAWEAAPWSR